MRYSIDTDVIERKGYTEAECLGMLFLMSCKRGLDEELDSMKMKGMIDMFNQPTMRASEDVQSIVLDSEESMPSDERIVNLASTLREFFPKGFKTGSYAWRGNLRDLSLRLKKFFKFYGDYTDEQIIDATKKYVESFNGDLTNMRILKYFIYKDDFSDLASMLENKDEFNNNSNLFVEMR